MHSSRTRTAASNQERERDAKREMKIVNKSCRTKERDETFLDIPHPTQVFNNGISRTCNMQLACNCTLNDSFRAPGMLRMVTATI